MPQIHRTAIVDDQAQLAEDVVIGPHCVIEGPVTLGPGCKLVSQCYLRGPLTLGANNTVYPFATLGLAAQDWKADHEFPGPGTLIGEGNIFREGSSIHRASKGDKPTTIGDRNYFMSGAHAAHDCQVGNDCMFANNALLGGHCEVDDRVIMGGNSAAQQYCRLGRLAMLGGCEGITMDLPPFCLIHHTKQVSALNLIGLRRAGLRPHLPALRECFNLFYRHGYTNSKSITIIEERLGGDALVDEFLAFVKSTNRGITGYGESFKHRPWLKPEFFEGEGNGEE
ncbi:MAG: acyl-ACP--UDP-N-acetylglucosamine O-acyltransferase [Planctomycetota bacterium]